MGTNNTIVLEKSNTNVVGFINTFVLDWFTMKYGERLRLAREKKGLSQEDLAKVSGVGQGTISKIERGDQNSSGYDAVLSYTLDIDAMWLYSGKDEFAPDWLIQSSNFGLKKKRKIVESLNDENWLFIEQMTNKLLQTQENNPKTLENNPNKPLTTPSKNVGGGVNLPVQQPQAHDRRVSDHDSRLMLKEMAIEQDRCVMERHKEALEINERYIGLIKESCKNNACYCEPQCKDANDHSRTMSFKALLSSAQNDRNKES
jgi:transcriptional regulator with XRE-family HTH domain